MTFDRISYAKYKPKLKKKQINKTKTTQIKILLARTYFTICHFNNYKKMIEEQKMYTCWNLWRFISLGHIFNFFFVCVFLNSLFFFQALLNTQKKNDWQKYKKIQTKNSNRMYSGRTVLCSSSNG